MSARSGGKKMVEPRRSQIVELVNREGKITFQRLKAAFPGLSDMTLRNDLRSLDAQGRLVRVHGGAKSSETLVRSDDLFFIKATRNMENKRLIAEKAVRLLSPGMTLFVDCGTTLMEFARRIPDEYFYIVSHSISSVLEISRLTKPEVVILGGNLNRYNLSAIDPQNSAKLEKLNFDIAFIATTGYASGRGFTCGPETDDQLRYAAIRRAKKIVILMDSSKVGRTLPITYATLDSVDTIISDDDLPRETADEFRAHGVEVL